MLITILLGVQTKLGTEPFDVTTMDWYDAVGRRRFYMRYIFF